MLRIILAFFLYLGTTEKSVLGCNSAADCAKCSGYILGSYLVNNNDTNNILFQMLPKTVLLWRCTTVLKTFLTRRVMRTVKTVSARLPPAPEQVII